MATITKVSGRGVPLRGHDIDTDRIMPARFLRAVSFDGLEKHLFEDDRAANPAHAFNNQRYKGATILVVNSNFCAADRTRRPARCSIVPSPGGARLHPTAVRRTTTASPSTLHRSGRLLPGASILVSR